MKLYHTRKKIEAGCDEAGRGCLAGPVYAAAVILPKGFRNPGIDDSKKLNRNQRDWLRLIIEKKALAWHIGICSPEEIDTHNILWASVLAMHRALDGLVVRPDHILVDGNRFKNYSNINHDCIIDGDAIYMSIAAASILAKTHRDEFMESLHHEYPAYGWNTNMGYPTPKHKKILNEIGDCPHHRKSFHWKYPDVQGELF